MKLPGAVQQEVNQCCGIADVNIVLPVAVGISHVDASSVTIEQVVDQGGGVGDIHFLVVVHHAFLQELQRR